VFRLFLLLLQSYLKWFMKHFVCLSYLPCAMWLHKLLFSVRHYILSSANTGHVHRFPCVRTMGKKTRRRALSNFLKFGIFSTWRLFLYSNLHLLLELQTRKFCLHIEYINNENCLSRRSRTADTCSDNWEVGTFSVYSGSKPIVFSYSSVDRSLLFGNSPSSCKEKRNGLKSAWKTQQDEEQFNEDLDWTVEFPYTHPAGFEDEERQSYLKSDDLSQLVRKHSRQSRIDDYIEKYEFTPGSYGAITGTSINEEEDNSEESSKTSRTKKKSTQSRSLSNSNTRRRKKKGLKNSFDTIFSPIYTFFQKPKTPTTSVEEHEKEEVPVTEPEEHESDSTLSCAPMVLDDTRELEEAKEMNVENPHCMESEQEHSETPFVLEDMEPYEFIAALPDASDICNFPSLCVPSKNASDPEITLVLDLDETLVHCSTEPCHDADLIFPVYFGGTEYLVYGRKRPYLDYFLNGKFILCYWILFAYIR